MASHWAQCVKGGGEFRSCLFVKTNECKLSVGLRRVLIQIDILLIQPFLPILWPKTVQMAINKPLVAISWPGGSEMADMRGSRLDQVRTHPGGCVGTISRVRNGHWGAPWGLKTAPNGHKWASCGHIAGLEAPKRLVKINCFRK